VMGPQGGDGLVDERSFFDFRQRNFSGRTAGIQFTPDTLAAEMLRYDPGLGPLLRSLVKAENAEDKTVDRLGAIYQEAMHREIAHPDTAPPPTEFSALYHELCESWQILSARETELAAVYASETWRWTAAFRRLVTLLRHPAPRRTE
jgi:hypothetical protein